MGTVRIFSWLQLSFYFPHYQDQIKISVQCTLGGGIKLYILRQAGKDGQREPGMKLNTIGKNCESKHMDVKGRVSTFT